MKGFVTHTIQPVFDKNSKILILGTIPSVKSRELGFYYAHPQNRFWKIVPEILDKPIPQTNAQKKEFLLENKIALWDVLKQCVIDNSDDSSIKDPEVNDIKLILKSAPIKAVFTTGKKATDLYNKYCQKETGVSAVYLPSTSPANCGRYKYEDLKEEYRAILKYL